MKLIQPERETLERQNSWQQAKHYKLQTDLIDETLKETTFYSCGFSAAEILISALVLYAIARGRGEKRKVSNWLSTPSQPRGSYQNGEKASKKEKNHKNRTTGKKGRNSKWLNKQHFHSKLDTQPSQNKLVVKARQQGRRSPQQK